MAGSAEKRKLICELNGGLGNQMFCFAAGFAVAQQMEIKMEVDISAYAHDGFGRKYELDCFDIQTPSSTLRRDTVWHKSIRKLKLLPYYKYTAKNQITELSDIPDLSGTQKSVFLRYDWHNQNYTLFHTYREELRKLLTYKGNKSGGFLDLQGSNAQFNTIAIHLRYGDYVGIGCVLDLEYYAKAIEQIRQNIIGKEKRTRLVVFSEDIETAKQIIDPIKETYDVLYVTKEYGLTDLEEFWLMTQCDHFIISNSTFSWWAAYLGEQENSVVVVPVLRGWISGCWEESYFPDNWERIEAKILKR